MVATQSAVLTFVIFTTSFTYGAVPRHKRSCEARRECLKPFPMLIDLVESDNAGALFTLTYDVLLDSVCSKQNDLAECMSRESCQVFEASYTAYAVKDALQYICGDGRNALLSEASCFSRDDFVWGVLQCSTELTLATDITTLKIQTGTSESTEFCKVFDTFLKCVNKNVRLTCSERAADFTSTVFAQAIQSLGSQIGCTIPLDSATG